MLVNEDDFKNHIHMLYCNCPVSIVLFLGRGYSVNLVIRGRAFLSHCSLKKMRP